MNDLIHWIAQTNPNVVLPVLGVVATWVWNRAHGDKTAIWRSLIDSILHTFMVELLDKYDPKTDVAAFLTRARTEVESKVWTVLAKRGVPRNPTTERWVHEAIEKASAWLGNEAAKLRIPIQFGEIAAKLDRADAELKTVTDKP